MTQSVKVSATWSRTPDTWLHEYESLSQNKILLLSEDNKPKTIDVLNSAVIDIPSQTEQDYLDYGMDTISDIEFYNDFTEKHYINNQPTPLGEGKVFEQQLDVNKIIKKVTIK